jgi:hypothetical protein
MLVSLPDDAIQRTDSYRTFGQQCPLRPQQSEGQVCGDNSTEQRRIL